jgi:hypothetical protein
MGSPYVNFKLYNFTLQLGRFVVLPVHAVAALTCTQSYVLCATSVKPVCVCVLAVYVQWRAGADSLLQCAADSTMCCCCCCRVLQLLA